MGIVIDCVSVAKEIKDRVKNELATIGTKPTLAIVSVVKILQVKYTLETK